ncbi:MAG: hypothetical protein J7M08_09250 [Planctomycetes bacterium]|nr:hypothetical protein [Planctomycetota bacterium]
MKDAYSQLMAISTTSGMPADVVLSKIGQLVNLSADLNRNKGLEHALALLDELLKGELASKHEAFAHYFAANAWSAIRHVKFRESVLWDWNYEGFEKEIVCFRKALRAAENEPTFPNSGRCQILTNLGNLFDHLGRCVEAVRYWDNALGIDEGFSMALANKGLGLFHYGAVLPETTQGQVFWWFAYGILKKSLEGTLSRDTTADVRRIMHKIQSRAKPGFPNVDVELHDFPLGDTQEEKEYRRWCLHHCLFLNPLNDLGPYPIAAHDCLRIKSVVVPIMAGPYFAGFFNQMKQEFVSARYLLFAGMQATEPHFSDRMVLLFNTMDYPVYSLAIEKQKLAFRSAYSLFDKIAFFLNHYLNLGIPERRVTFRTLWYQKCKRKYGLRQELPALKNWPLCGLFWLSKDLYEDVPGFRQSMHAEAKDLADIRNHLEHKYLKVHQELWPGPPAEDDNLAQALSDTLAHSVYRPDFTARALTILRMARAALIYLVLAVYREESQRAAEREPDAVPPPMTLDVWEDDWKR